MKKILYLVEFVVFGMIGLTLYVVFPEQIWVSILGGNLFLLFFMYGLIREWQQAKLQNYLKEVSRVIRVVTEDTDENIRVVGNILELDGFYEEIEHFSERNRVKEKGRLDMMGIVNSIATHMELENMLNDLMPKVISVSRSNCTAFYMVNQATKKLEIKHSIGFNKNLYGEFDVTVGEGFLGAYAATLETQIITDIPEDTVYVIRSFLGKIKPKSIMIVPIANQDQLAGVLMLASIFEYTKEHLEMLNLIKYYIGIAIANGITYEQTKRLTNELRFQNKLIQNLNEDLEKKVQDRTLFLNDIIDSIMDYAIYAMDRNGIISVWNKGAEQILGYSADEVVGKSIETIYPVELVKAGIIRDRIDVVLRYGKYMEKGWRQRKDGTMNYVEMSMFARYNDKGEIIGITNVTKDITSLRNTESSLALANELAEKFLHETSRSIVLTDTKGQILNANANAINMIRMVSSLSDEVKMNSISIGDVVGSNILNYFVENADAMEALVSFESALPKKSENRRKRVHLQAIDSDFFISIAITALGEEDSDARILFMDLRSS